MSYFGGIGGMTLPYKRVMGGLFVFIFLFPTKAINEAFVDEIERKT